MSRTYRKPITGMRNHYGPSSVREPVLCGDVMQLGYPPAHRAGRRHTKRRANVLRRVADQRAIATGIADYMRHA